MQVATVVVKERIRGISRIHLGHLASALLFILALASPFLFFGYVKAVDLYKTCYLEGYAETCTNAATHRHFVASAWLALVSISMTAGCLGTILSFFLRQTRNEPINIDVPVVNAPQAYIGFREIVILCFFGSIFGLLMLSLFLGGFVQGSLFPSFMSNMEDSFLSISIRISGWAKIFVWCFLAGFSERLIPDLLDNLVKRAGPGAEPSAPNGRDGPKKNPDNPPSKP